MLNQLEIFEQQKCKGAILRSKAQFTLESDRCTAYFLNLEKSKQQNNTIKELLLTDGTITCNTEGILDRAHEFYSELYTADNVDVVKSEELVNLIDRCIGEDDKHKCDLPIADEELTCALKGMQRNKSPGPDGLTVEFYLKFWDILLPFFKKVIECIFSNGELTPSMKRSNISLFFKNKGSRNDLKNFRPISLINVDCKIISRALSLRLRSVMSSIVSLEQTCAVPGRDIANNLHAIRDVVDIISEKDELNFLVKIDQEKAFDRVSHQYMFKVLKKFDFGDNFIKWIKILYNNIKSSVKCNGHLTPYFIISRGVRQGDPMSSMLYVLLSEPLNLLLKSQAEIKGVTVTEDIYSFIYQHADDTTLTVSTVSSVENIFRYLDYYGQGTGSKVNVNKSEVLVLGKTESNIKLDIPVNIKTDGVEVLGIFVGQDKTFCESKNWKNKIQKIQLILNSWKQRRLSLQGKATVLNILITSRLWYSFTVLPVPHWVEKAFTQMFSKFLWHNKPAKIAALTLLGQVKDGGLNIPNLRLKVFSFRLKLVKKIQFTDCFSLWTKTMVYYLSKFANMNLGINTLSLSFNKKDLETIHPFYRELLQAWDELTMGRRLMPLTIEEILSQPLFHNPNIVYHDKMLSFKSFVTSGITCIKHICYEVVPGFLPLNSITEMIHDVLPDEDVVDIEKAFSVILHSLPSEWQNCILNKSVDKPIQLDISVPTDEGPISCNNLTAKFCYQMFVKKYFKEPAGKLFWEKFALDLNWKDIWRNVNNNDKSAESIQLDFKIAHNIVFTYEKLFNIGQVDTNLCQVCHAESEDIFHLFIFCQLLKPLHNLLREILIDVCKDGFTFGQFSLWLLFGFLPENVCAEKPVIDILLSVYRLCVYKRRIMATYGSVNSNIVIMFKNMFQKHMSLLLVYYTHQKNRVLFMNKYIYHNDIIKVENDDVYLNENFL